ncbi:unnamed protein product [Boreogadus saida]
MRLLIPSSSGSWREFKSPLSMSTKDMFVEPGVLRRFSGAHSHLSPASLQVECEIHLFQGGNQSTFRPVTDRFCQLVEVGALLS